MRSINAFFRQSIQSILIAIIPYSVRYGLSVIKDLFRILWKGGGQVFFPMMILAFIQIWREGGMERMRLIALISAIVVSIILVVGILRVGRSMGKDRAQYNELREWNNEHDQVV